MNTYSRRGILTSLAATATAAQAQRPPRLKPWKPKLGVLGRFTASNVEFARQEGFSCIGLWAQPKTSLDVDLLNDQAIEKVKASISRSGLKLSAIACVQNHIAPDRAARNSANAYFAKVIELAGRLTVSYVGTSSGSMPGRPLAEQVQEIVKIYEQKYFALCQKYKVRILWEPWAGGPNIATGPVGYEALFKAFDDSPYVGLQYDPSHLVWQMMDPIQCARDFAGKIYDVHLKDTEILWPVLRKVGITPLNDARWWRFRLPGMGAVDWRAFFTSLMEAGFEGAMNIEHEDSFYGWPYPGDEFSEAYKTGFRAAHHFLRQFVPA
jgi:sugar phosphate isomerase/epimerase